MKRISCTPPPTVTNASTKPGSSTGSASQQETVQVARQTVGHRATELVNGLRRLIKVQEKVRQLRAQVALLPPQDIGPPQQLVHGTEVQTLKATLDRARLLPMMPCAGATAYRTDRAYCHAVLWAREATLRSVHLPLTCAALLDPSPAGLEQARLEVLRQIGMTPTQTCCIDLLVQLLQMNPGLGLVLPAAAIPPGEPGQRMLHALTEAFHRCGEHRPPFAVEGTLPPYVKPRHLPASTPLPFPPAQAPGHAPDLKHAVALARSLAALVQACQQEQLAPRERLHTQDLRHRMAETELATQVRLVEEALHQCRMLATFEEDDDSRLAHGWAALLLHRLVRGFGLELPHTQAALAQQPPPAALLDEARREVMGLLLNDCCEPGLSTLLTCLLRLDPNAPLRLGLDNLPDGDDVGIEETLAVLLPAWPTRGAPRLVLDTLQSGDDSSPATAPTLDMQALFVQPGLERLCVRKFNVDNDQLNLIADRVRQQGSDLKELEWQNGTVVQIRCAGFAALVEALPALEKVSLYIEPEIGDEAPAPEGTPVFRHPLPAALSQALVAKPLKSLEIEFFGETLDPPMAVLLAPLVEALRAHPQGVAWASVSLTGVCDSAADDAVIEAWLAQLVASPAVHVVDLNVDMTTDHPGYGKPGCHPDELGPALERRQQPLELCLQSNLAQTAPRFSLDLFMGAGFAEATGSSDAPEPALAPCIRAVTLRFDWDCSQVPAFLRQLTQAINHMPQVRQLVLATTAGLSRRTDRWPGQELQAFTRTWRQQPHIDLIVSGDNVYAQEFRRQLGRISPTPWMRQANGWSLQALLSQRTETRLPLEIYEEIGQLAGNPSAKHPWDSLPIVNRTQLLATVAAYNEMVRATNNASRGQPDRVKLTRPHPLAKAARLVEFHQAQEAEQAARREKADQPGRPGL